MEYRIDKDTMGSVHVPADAYYGAQTQRSIDNFKIAQDINKMPKEIIKAFAYLKKAAALTNLEAGVLTKEKSDMIGKVADEILAGKLDEYFPLVVWQTGSGTQSNMNVNEVIAYRGHVLNGGKLADKEKFIHPNDDVNKFIDRPKAVTIGEAVQFIDKINDVIAKREGMYWGIHLKDDHKVVGAICYWNIIEEKQCADIGYELHPCFQGKGIMQEAIEKVISFGFENMQLEMITAFTHFDNKNSIKLLKKNKFIRNEKLEQEMKPDLGTCIIYTLSTSAK